MVMVPGTYLVPVMVHYGMGKRYWYRTTGTGTCTGTGTTGTGIAKYSE